MFWNNTVKSQWFEHYILFIYLYMQRRFSQKYNQVEHINSLLVVMCHEQQNEHIIAKFS